jgi:hypothetical protein
MRAAILSKLRVPADDSRLREIVDRLYMEFLSVFLLVRIVAPDIAFDG